MADAASKLLEWVAACERHAEAKNAFAVLAYMNTVQEIGGDAKERLLAAGAEVLGPHERRAEAPVVVLSEEERMELWRLFASKLREAGLDPEAYRPRFEALVAPNLDFEGNRLLLLDEVKSIVAEASLRRKEYVGALPKPPVRFSWRYVGWGLASMKLDAEAFREAVRARDALAAYMALTRILEAAEKLKLLLRAAPGAA
jgi:hypothetical protein